MKRLFFILSLLFAMHLGAQEVADVVIVDITELTQYLSEGSKDKTSQRLAFAKTFAESERGADMLQRLDLCIQRAGNAMLNQGAKKAQETFTDNNAKNFVDEMYDRNLADYEKWYKAGDISKEEFEQLKAENEEMRAEVLKGVLKEMNSMKGIAKALEGTTSGENSEMPEDPRSLINDLKRYAIGGKAWRYVHALGRGTVKVTDKEGYEDLWGVMNLLDREIFPQQYDIRDYNPKRNFIILKKKGQYGMFRYSGENIIPFSNNEMWEDALMEYPIRVTPQGYQALNENGKVMFTYPYIVGENGCWTVRNKEKKWGAVGNDGTILIPIKYNKIFPADGDNGEKYMGGYTTPGTDDMDLYDLKTKQMVGKRINGKIILNK